MLRVRCARCWHLLAHRRNLLLRTGGTGARFEVADALVCGAQEPLKFLHLCSDTVVQNQHTQGSGLSRLGSCSPRVHRVGTMQPVPFLSDSTSGGPLLMPATHNFAPVLEPFGG